MRYEQYEIWVQQADKWERVAWFRELDVASALARSRPGRVRLLHVIYDDGKQVEQQVLAELGARREQP